MKKSLKALATLSTATVLALTAACGSSGSADSGSDGNSGDKTTLTVLAAASLTETFDNLKQTYESEHPEVTVKIVYDSSATLAEMAEQGAPGDVLATADQTTMDGAVDAGAVDGQPTQFASNVVTLAVPAENPAKINSFADLNTDGVDYVVCVKTAPCGAAADKLLRQDKVTRKPVSEEVDVKSVLARITGNDADAGLVYATDVKAAGDAVKGFEVPGAAAEPNTYWVATTAHAEATTAAQDWIDLMLSDQGQQVFEDAGFGAK